MQLCKNCYITMNGVMSFSKDKHERFYKCPKCFSETRHQRIKDSELNFEEELNKAIHKRK